MGSLRTWWSRTMAANWHEVLHQSAIVTLSTLGSGEEIPACKDALDSAVNALQLDIQLKSLALNFDLMMRQRTQLASCPNGTAAQAPPPGMPMGLPAAPVPMGTPVVNMVPTTPAGPTPGLDEQHARPRRALDEVACAAHPYALSTTVVFRPTIPLPIQVRRLIEKQKLLINARPLGSNGPRWSASCRRPSRATRQWSLAACRWPRAQRMRCPMPGPDAAKIVQPPSPLPPLPPIPTAAGAASATEPPGGRSAGTVGAEGETSSLMAGRRFGSAYPSGPGSGGRFLCGLPHER